MAMEYKTVSLADRVFNTIEKSILIGEYKQGEIITEKQLSQELGVSRTPIREALSRLAEEDLIETMPQGNIVRGITDDDIDDAYTIRKLLEVEAVRRAAENASDDEIELMKENVEQQEFYMSKKNDKKIRDLDTEFHNMIYISCKSRLMHRMLSQIHHKLMHFRRSSLGSSNVRMDRSTKEHFAIYEAIRDHDPDAAEKAMLFHLQNTYESINIVRGKLEDKRDEQAK